MRKNEFIKKYGKDIETLTKELNVCAQTISNWDRLGYDLIEKAKNFNVFRGNKHLQRLWGNMKSRCENPLNKRYKSYGGKGIRIELTKHDILFLWKRDKAHLLEKASIDRINPEKNYSLENCRFIEMSDNSRRHNFKLNNSKKYDPNGQEKISKFLKTSTGLIIIKCGYCKESWTPRTDNPVRCPRCQKKLSKRKKWKPPDGNR